MTVTRFAAGELNVLVLVFWTNLWMFILMCCWVAFRHPQGGLGTKRLAGHFLRSIFTYGALVTYFFAVINIPFANAVILQSMGPLFVPILAFLIFRRLSDRFVWLGVFISFAGVLLIVRPDNVGISIGDLSALLAALGGVAAALVIWSLATTEPPVRQMFYFSLFASSFIRTSASVGLAIANHRANDPGCFDCSVHNCLAILLCQGFLRGTR